jgi:hypothetical protein
MDDPTMDPIKPDAHMIIEIIEPPIAFSMPFTSSII